VLYFFLGPVVMMSWPCLEAEEGPSNKWRAELGMGMMDRCRCKRG
jgi:hypothetical protein